MQKLIITLVFGVLNCILIAQNPNLNYNKFKQLHQEFATPNEYRTGSGAPGHAYYQQKADYKIKVTLDDNKQTVSGSETITYTNNSPDALEYLWVQLDQNVRAKNSATHKINTNSIKSFKNFDAIDKEVNPFDGGFKLQYVKDKSDKNISYSINGTMMRINLEKPLQPNQSYSFKIKWWYNINDRMQIGGRSGYEYFEKDDNYLYTIAQFYPRMAVYNDVEGWQNKQFLGRGEFALPFGDFEVSITVPSDHIVASTGTLQNEKQVLTTAQQKRWAQAKNEFVNPVFIVNKDEAIENEKDKSGNTKTWVFKAENVRDFAFATSRKFLWDAMAVKQDDGSTVMAVSYYPKEGMPLWDKYSTKVVAHTLKTYSKFTFPYPYPKAISVHSKQIGMEYPMICFNFGRPNEDGTYSDRTKYGMIHVIIHEVGHNYFPMIVNSDERQWTWMDEGLNTFLQYLTEQEWERDFPSRRGPAHKIVQYMLSNKDNITPIMTNSESIYQFGNNAYGKPATALNILRETVLGRELFDYAFKTYANRWKFKHPTPEDFFRTMEDASGTDLDWFWRGWFYSTDYCEIAIDKITWYKMNTQQPEMNMAEVKEKNNQAAVNISTIRNGQLIKETYNEKDPNVNDFYNKKDKYEVDAVDIKNYENYIAQLNEKEKKILNSGYNFYEIKFKNNGGLVMPIILQFEYEDGSKEVERIPAEIWKMNDKEVTKVFIKSKKVKSIQLDPFLETSDVDVSNNSWPSTPLPSRFKVFKAKKHTAPTNAMQKARKAKELEKENN